MNELSKKIEYMLTELERVIMKDISDTDDSDDEELSIEDFNTITKTVFDNVYDSCMYHIMEENYNTIWYENIECELLNFIDLLPSFIQQQISVHMIEYMIEYIYDIIKTNIIPRSCSQQHQIVRLPNSTKKIELLRKINKTLPKQRTDEWFKMRNDIISASSLWKVFHTESVYNQLIYEKCSGVHLKYSSNINSPLHWGQKYEPVAQLFYNYTYDATIEEYGCIPHQKYTFLGASPDGVNVNEKSDRYGRLLEIKCIKNREITGVPKKEYWIQMQSQMECCDIDMCDFLECRFIEYQNKEEFEKDGTYLTTANGNLKGIILCFQDEYQQIVYKYKPLDYDRQESENWVEQCLHETSHMTYIHTYYWYLNEYSCLTIERNTKWFAIAFPKIKTIWDTIQYEKEHGYTHRASAPRKKKKEIEIETCSFDTKGKCLVDL